MCLQCCSKRVITKRWVAEIVRQRVPGNRVDNWGCLTTELAVTMSWNDELVAAGIAKVLMAGNIRSTVWVDKFYPLRFSEIFSQTV